MFKSYFLCWCISEGSEERKRMDYTTFVYIMQHKVKEKICSNIVVEVHRALKNNGTVRIGLSFKQPEVNISPTIYLEEFYEQYLNGESISTLALSVQDVYEKVKVNQSFPYNNILEYSKIKDRIVYKIIRINSNEKLLEEVPHEKFMDLAIVYYALMETTEFGTATLLIRNEHLHGWKVAEEEIKESARKNTPKLLPLEIMMLTDSMFVLTNNKQNLGAAVILYDNVLEQIRAMFGENYYILPSSIHEVILVPESYGMDPGTMKEMVMDINRTGVEAEDVLSDNVYYYNCELECFSG